MTNEEKAFAKATLRLLKAEGIKIRGAEDYDNEENYVGTRYYLARSGYPGEVAVSIECLHDAQFANEPTLSPYLPPSDEERAEHLARYLVNTAKRTSQEWIVVERYKTKGVDWRGEAGYHRALLEAEDGSTVRIYYKWWSKCWVRGQKVLAPKSI